MDESRSWRRGFAAGFTALALAVGGQVAVRAADESAATPSCALSRRMVWSRFSHRAAPRADAQSLAQRVARAVIGAVLHGCS